MVYYINKSTILNLQATYRTAITRYLIRILEHILIYYEQIYSTVNHMCCIMFPLSLCRIILNLIHDTPFAGNMCEYKTLYHIRSRFF